MLQEQVAGEPPGLPQMARLPVDCQQGHQYQCLLTHEQLHHCLVVLKLLVLPTLQMHLSPKAHLQEYLLQ